MKKMFAKCVIICFVLIKMAWTHIIFDIHENANYVHNNSLETNNTGRQARWFPFHTIGRFENLPCVGRNQLLGTCVLAGECLQEGGVSTGSCNTITRQAVCCVYQQSCRSTISNNNTYFVSPMYPGQWNGATQTCSMRVLPCSSTVCQLRLDFLDLSLAQPNGDGICNTDLISITGGAAAVPTLCGENSGQHIVVDFMGTNAITITIQATAAFIFGRHWNIRATQINCNSQFRAPPGCLQYHFNPNGVIRSFNYDASPNPMLNAIGVQGTRQIAHMNYGICISSTSACSITYSLLASDRFSFTLTGDVGAVDPALLGTGTLQSQTCITDYIIIPNPMQAGAALSAGSDRFCGLGFNPTTSNMRPFILFARTDANEELDISNRGFALIYTQNPCPVAQISTV